MADLAALLPASREGDGEAFAAGPESGHIVNRYLVILLATLGCALASENAAGQDLCAFIAKHGPAVFGTPLQAAAQCDRQGDLTSSGAANNASGSDRLEISIVKISGVEGILDGVRRETREGRVLSDEPSLGKGAILERSDKGRLATFHFVAHGGYVRVSIRARDGLTDAYVARARQLARTLASAS